MSVRTALDGDDTTGIVPATPGRTRPTGRPHPNPPTTRATVTAPTAPTPAVTPAGPPRAPSPAPRPATAPSDPAPAVDEATTVDATAAGRRALRDARRERRRLAGICTALVAAALVMTVLIVGLARDRPDHGAGGGVVVPVAAATVGATASGAMAP